MNHFLECVHKDDTVTQFGDNTLLTYTPNGEKAAYLLFRPAQDVIPSTIANEMSTANVFMNSFYSIKKSSSFAHFHLPKFDRAKYDKSGGAIRQETFQVKNGKALQ